MFIAFNLCLQVVALLISVHFQVDILFMACWSNQNTYSMGMEWLIVIKYWSCYGFIEVVLTIVLKVPPWCLCLMMCFDVRVLYKCKPLHEMNPSANKTTPVIPVHIRSLCTSWYQAMGLTWPLFWMKLELYNSLFFKVYV